MTAIKWPSVRRLCRTAMLAPCMDPASLTFADDRVPSAGLSTSIDGRRRSRPAV